MNRAATGSLPDADVVLFVIEASGWRGSDEHVLQRLANVSAPVVLVVNKADLVRPKSKMLPLLEECQQKHAFAEIIPVSALAEDNLDRLMAVVLEHLSAGERFYPEEMKTDRGHDFRIAEVLREKLMETLDREVPYGLAVDIGAVEETAGLVKIDALIWVAKDSQRPIVVGRGGVTLKNIGALHVWIGGSARQKVLLQTHVKGGATGPTMPARSAVGYGAESERHGTCRSRSRIRTSRPGVP